MIRERFCLWEYGYRIPGNNTLIEMSKILNVNYIYFSDFIPVAPRILCLHSFGSTEMIEAWFLYLNSFDIPVDATPLIINLCVTMAMTAILQ